MFILRKFNYKSFFIHSLAAMLFFLLTSGAFTVCAQELPVNKPAAKDLVKKKTEDTLKMNRIDTVKGRDTIAKTVQTADTFDIKLSKDTIDAPIDYSAVDSMVLDIPGKKVYLYTKGTLQQKDIDLKAPYIELDQMHDMLYAKTRKDTSGQSLGYVYLKQGESQLRSDSIAFSSKSKRGITYGTFTQQDDYFLYSQKAKKVGDDVLFGLNNVFSTCNYDDPHFGIHAKKVKFITKKVAVTGPAQMEFEGVPTPLWLPFGIFPITSGRQSGLIIPQFAVNQNYGIGLEGLGYYKVLNEYFDITALSNIYSYGGWQLTLRPNYRVRYRFNGGLTISLLTTKNAFKGDPDYQKSKNFSVSWFHTVDSKARPGTNFTASVNFASTSFNSLVPNNTFQNFNNNLSSSITYSKAWQGKPYNLTVSANHNQNNNTRLINVTLPDLGFTVNTIYPFQNEESVTPKWYDKLGFGYNGNFRSQVSFYDTAFSIQKLKDTLQWGAQHNFPIQFQLPPMGIFQIGPSVSYSQRWYSQKFIRSWNQSKKKVDSAINKGIYLGHEISFGINLSTAIFGMFTFNKNSHVQAIRHVIRPTIGFSYKPDLASGSFYDTQIDTTGRRYRFSKYEGSLFGPYSEGNFGGITLTLDNNLEMKVKNTKDTADGKATKKIKLIDGFGLTTSYNLMADSFNLSTINLYARTNLFEKINITMTGVLDPYQVDSRGNPINRYVWQDGFSLGRFVSGTANISTALQSKPKDANKAKNDMRNFTESQTPQTIEDAYQEIGNIQNNPSEYVDFNIAWNLQLSYGLTFTRQIKSDYSGFTTELTQSFNFGGDFSLTPKWKVGANGMYDIKTKRVQYLTAFITREMHCWQLSINITPIGTNKFFNITISPKSPILRDLKINRTRYFYGR